MRHDYKVTELLLKPTLQNLRMQVEACPFKNKHVGGFIFIQFLLPELSHDYSSSVEMPSLWRVNLKFKNG